MVDVLPELATAKFVSVSDDEFTGLMQIFLKGAFRVKEHGGGKKECSVYVSDFR
jgi:hypothetical protein